MYASIASVLSLHSDAIASSHSSRCTPRRYNSSRIGQGRDAAKQYLRDNPEVAEKLDADIRRDFYKLMSNQSKAAARAAGRPVNVSADDFDDEDDGQ